MVNRTALDIFHSILPFLVVGMVGLPVLFASVRLAKWRTCRQARKAGMVVVPHERVVTDPHALILTPDEGRLHAPIFPAGTVYRSVKSHRA